MSDSFDPPSLPPHDADLSTASATATLAGRRVAFVGKLGGLNRREAEQFVREHGGITVDAHDSNIDLLVIGADELPLVDEHLLTQEHRQEEAAGRLEIINETQLWERLDLVPAEGSIRQLYTPAMLADLLGVSISVVRRWHRRGLIVPVREVHRLVYFDYQQVATARHLAKLLQAGASPLAIERKLAQLAHWLPDVERPLAQLSIIVEGRDLLLRQGEGLIDVTGQRRIDFEASERSAETGDATFPTHVTAVYSLHDVWVDGGEKPDITGAELKQQATELEEEGRLAEAVDLYRAILAMEGPDAEINFMMAELLYRLGDISAARERYYSALELDEDYVEARANLGCVLAELGQFDLAVAAFEGALSRHDDYPDVHFHLARVLDELGRDEAALDHWRFFLRLAPDSPWANEARDRLGLEI